MNEITLKAQKLIAARGYCSRREAEKLILGRQVFVNRQLVTIGDRFPDTVDITVEGELLPSASNIKNFTYYLLNKPIKTITSSHDNYNRQTVLDLVPEKPRVFAVGRLDYNTTGAILLTNNGELAYRLQHPKWKIARVYRVRVHRPLTRFELQFLNSERVEIDNVKSTQTVRHVETKTYVVTLRQGLNHHIRKLFELVDCDVLNLTRIEFAGLTHAEKIKRGSYYPLSIHEVKKLKKLVDL